MLWFNFTLGTNWYFPFFQCMVIYMYDNEYKTKEMLDFANGKVKPQHHHMSSLGNTVSNKSFLYKKILISPNRCWGNSRTFFQVQSVGCVND